jgi:hypothetical protein
VKVPVEAQIESVLWKVPALVLSVTEGTGVEAAGAARVIGPRAFEVSEAEPDVSVAVTTAQTSWPTSAATVA